MPAQVAKRVTETTPIVFVGVGDPVAGGLVASRARPGGNATGLISLSLELGAKRLELIKAAAPAVTRVAVLSNPAEPDRGLATQVVEATARELGLELLPLDVRGPEEAPMVYAAAEQERIDALLVLGTLINWTGALTFATHNRLPTMADRAEFVYAGGLMAYAPSLPDIYRRAAVYVDKILNGARPEDLPVDRPRRFRLLLNRPDRASARLDNTAIDPRPGGQRRPGALAVMSTPGPRPDEGDSVASMGGAPRGSLFRKYLTLFVILVTGGLATSGLLDLYFSYREITAALSRAQRSEALAWTSESSSS